MGKADPTKGEVAAHARPLIGPYDSADPAVIAYQVALMKAAGIDGAIIDWNGPGGFPDYAMIHRNTGLLIAELRRAGLRFAICAEDNPGNRFLRESGRTRAEATARVAASFAWLDQHWLRDEAYLRIGGRPVLLLFGPQYLEPTEWREIRRALTTDPLVLALPHLRARLGADGGFAWIPVSGGKDVEPAAATAALAHLYGGLRADRAFAAVAYPGYRDYYAEAGAGRSFGRIEAQGGDTFARSLDQALASGAALVQVATWNDYGEGTVIEPTVADGHRHLRTLRRRLAPQGADDVFPGLTEDFLKNRSR
jgi:hypothetical protein